LQAALKEEAASCEAVSDSNFFDVSTSTSDIAIMSSSTYFVGYPLASQASTTHQLSSISGSSFVTGRMAEADANQSAVINLDSSEFTEVEYILMLTDNATSSAYCFRASNSGSSLDSYTKVAELLVYQSPVITNISLNGGQDIVLLENSTTTVIVTSTISDLNGYSDIDNIIGRIYRSGVSGGESCTLNENDCYQSSCATSSCAGESCMATCNFDVWFNADPTDGEVGQSNETPWSSEYWVAWIEATDKQTTSGSATNTSQLVEVLSLLAFEIVPSIDYGDDMFPGQSIDPLNVTTTVIATGNCSLDMGLYGTAMVSGIYSIASQQQRFATSAVSYSSASSLSGTEQELEFNLPKTVTSTNPYSDDIWWGIQIPIPQQIGSYTGLNTFIGKKNELGAW
jgi:hypothetical protein